MIDSNERILTNERLRIYKRNRKINFLLFVALVFIALIRGTNDYGELLVLLAVTASVWCLYLFVTKQTAYQLRKQELKIGKKEAKKILQSAGVKTSNS